MSNYKKDKSYIIQRLEYVSPVDYIIGLENEIEILQQENEKLLKKSYSDDVKITKAIELISKEFLCYDNESDEYTQGKKVINILNGGDEE